MFYPAAANADEVSFSSSPRCGSATRHDSPLSYVSHRASRSLLEDASRAPAPQLPARASFALHARQRCTREPPIDHVVRHAASRHRTAILRTQGLFANTPLTRPGLPTFRAADRRPKLSQQPPLVLKSCPCPTSNSPHLRHGNPAAAAEVSTSRTQARSHNTRVALPMALRRRHGSVALGRPMTLRRGTGWSTHGT